MTIPNIVPAIFSIGNRVGGVQIARKQLDNYLDGPVLWHGRGAKAAEAVYQCFEKLPRKLRWMIYKELARLECKPFGVKDIWKLPKHRIETNPTEWKNVKD